MAASKELHFVKINDFTSNSEILALTANALTPRERGATQEMSADQMNDNFLKIISIVEKLLQQCNGASGEETASKIKKTPDGSLRVTLRSRFAHAGLAKAKHVSAHYGLNISGAVAQIPPGNDYDD